MAVATLGHKTFFILLNLNIDYFDKVKVGEKIIAKDWAGDA
jgi:hypothetical protein